MKKIVFSVISILSTSAMASLHLGTPLLPHKNGQIIVSRTLEMGQVSTSLTKNRTIQAVELLNYPLTRQTSRQLVLYTTFGQQAAEKLAEELENDPRVNWIQPNYIFSGDPREMAREFNDPLYKDQIHHQIIQTKKAFEIHRGSKDVILALTDDGAEYTHPDLIGAFWQNPDELANGQDDDGNGLVDDLMGWDFSSDLADIMPHPEQGHGTHLAGIISARDNNGEGVVGAAPGITLLPIKFYGGPNSWTSAVVASAFNYAIQKGAHIISTSYGTDWFANDLVYNEVVNYAFLQGVILFNSAGNNRQENPPRLINDQVLFVAATNTISNVDRKTSFSNYGYGVDISAPGEQIYSTYIGGSYRAESGTSMATPLAASVAALIWSEFPQYSAAQVIARLLATTDPIDQFNSRYQYKLGVGRINSFRALSEEVPPPQLKAVEGIAAASKIKKINSLRLILKNILVSTKDTGVNHPEAFELVNLSEQRIIPFTSKSFHQLLSNKIDFTFDTLPLGKYLFRAKAKYLIDPFGQELDGNGDKVAGDDFLLPFEVINSYSY